MVLKLEEQAQRSMEMLAHTATLQMLGRSRPALSRKAPAQTTTIFSREIHPKINHRAAECGFHILSQESSTCFCFWGLLEKCSSPVRNWVWLWCLPNKHKSFHQQWGSGLRRDPKVRKSTINSPGRVLQAGMVGEGTAEPWWSQEATKPPWPAHLPPL